MNSNESTSFAFKVVRFASKPPATGLPSWCPVFLNSNSTCISPAQQRTRLIVNQVLIITYWHIGNDILDRQSRQGWGTNVINRHSAGKKDGNPGNKDLSPRNLKYMWSSSDSWTTTTIVQPPLAQLPCYHHIEFLDELDEESRRTWYSKLALFEELSRNYVARQVEANLHKRSGQVTANFDTVLCASTSLIDQNAMNDQYVFEHLKLIDTPDELGLEAQSLPRVEHVLVELRRELTFVGRQLRLDVIGDASIPDLDFCRFILRYYVVVELKVGRFELGFLGQLATNKSAVDKLLAQPGDEPTIGMLLYKSRNSVVL